MVSSYDSVVFVEASSMFHIWGKRSLKTASATYMCIYYTAVASISVINSGN